MLHPITKRELETMRHPILPAPRRLTRGEAASLAEDYPQIDPRHVWVIGGASGAYNSVAWTLGITDRWVWPGPTPARFNEFYAAHRERYAASGRVAAYGTARGMTHAALRTAVNAGGVGVIHAWTSKLGEDLLIAHALGDIAGQSSTYGDVVQSYEPRAPRGLEAALPSDAPPDLPAPFTPSADDRGALARRAVALPADLRARFDAAYAAWQATWSDASVRTSSDPAARTLSPEFRDVVALGEAALPLLMAKLADPTKFFTLQAIDRVTPPRARVQFDPDDPAVLGGEQYRAGETLRRWLAARG
jgi:hypothetical protein